MRSDREDVSMDFLSNPFVVVYPFEDPFGQIRHKVHDFGCKIYMSRHPRLK